MTDETIDVIASLPNLTELSIRLTDISDASIARIAKLPKLKRLTIKDNPKVSNEALKTLKEKQWEKLDIGNVN